MKIKLYAFYTLADTEDDDDVLISVAEKKWTEKASLQQPQHHTDQHLAPVCFPRSSHRIYFHLHLPRNYDIHSVSGEWSSHLLLTNTNFALIFIIS